MSSSFEILLCMRRSFISSAGAASPYPSFGLRDAITGAVIFKKFNASFAGLPSLFFSMIKSASHSFTALVPAAASSSASTRMYGGLAMSAVLSFFKNSHISPSSLPDNPSIITSGRASYIYCIALFGLFVTPTSVKFSAFSAISLITFLQLEGSFSISSSVSLSFIF